jgi:hypothetical protein
MEKLSEHWIESSGEVLLLEGEIIEFETEELKEAYKDALSWEQKRCSKKFIITISNKVLARKWGGMMSATLTVREIA